MIAIAIIIALSAALIAVLHKYWQNIIKWIKKAVEKIKEALGIVVQGTKTFIVKTREGLQNKAKYYNENKMTGEWEETVYSKSIEESEVPEEILLKIRAQSFDIEISSTEELRLAISA